MPTQPEKCGKRKRKQVVEGTLQHLSVAEMRKLLPHVKNVGRLARAKLCALLNVEQGYIKYDGQNSCFVDTTITALLHRPKNTWVKRNILKKTPPYQDYPALQKIALDIRSAITELYNVIQGGFKTTTCSQLRTLFKNFDLLYAKTFPQYKPKTIEWTHSQQEPADVANMLSKIFDIPADIRYKFTSSTEKRVESHPFNHPVINFDVLMSNKKVYLKDYLPTYIDSFVKDDGSQYKKKCRSLKGK